MILFNQPLIIKNEEEYIKKVFKNDKLCGDGEFTKKCHHWFKQNYNVNALLTTSGTHALEMAAILADIKPWDEVIMPSYTFVSTANAFVLRGANVVFVDIRPDTMNIDETLIESAITEKTKAIVPVHYAGVSCEMDSINKTGKKYNLLVIEDSAQGIMARYNGRYLGTIGDFGCLSFHETKNITCGEGGAIFLNNEKYFELAEIIREKGTNRSKFWRGEVDKYTWVNIGSSYLPSELNAAFLFAQLELVENITINRLNSWNLYNELLRPLQELSLIELPVVPNNCSHNAHMFFIKVRDIEQRSQLIDYLRKNGIMSVFHYIPLHSSPFGKMNTRFHGDDIYTTKESERLIRLPMYYDIQINDIEKIVKVINDFFFLKEY